MQGKYTSSVFGLIFYLTLCENFFSGLHGMHDKSLNNVLTTQLIDKLTNPD